ncbi:MAG TPA: VOC family protein [Actinomycetota bacterium]|nr:VOC family protein [Actinomycetota bacterium]
MANGQIGWVELHAPDANKLADFYEQAFGWKIQKDPNMPDYVMFTEPGGDIGGGFSSQIPKAGGQMYLLTDDIDETLETVKKAGGKTTKERTLITEDIGSWAQFEDPAGNVMGLFEQKGR